MLESITEFDLSTKRVMVASGDVTYHDTSPQARMSTLARPLLQTAREGEWERGFFGLAKLIAQQKQMDPLLRFILLRRVLEVGREGSHSLRVASGPLWDRLEASDVDVTANWLVWNDPDARKARAQAYVLLGTLDDLNALGQETVEQLRRDTSRLPPLPLWVGWLRPAGEHKWCCEPGSPTKASGDLVVICRQTDTAGDQKPAWHKVGNCSGDEIQWVEASSALVAGRPLFLVPSAAEANRTPSDVSISVPRP